MPLPPMRLLCPLALAALSLAACTTTGPASPSASSGAPLPNEGYDWHFNQNFDEASLSYGMAETDDVPMDLSCRTGSPNLTLLLNVAKGSPKRIQLESGGETETYRATAEPSPLSDGLDLTATAPISDPVFIRFKQLGWLAVHANGQRRALAATEAGLPQIQRFFEICNPTQ